MFRVVGVCVFQVVMHDTPGPGGDDRRIPGDVLEGTQRIQFQRRFEEDLDIVERHHGCGPGADYLPQNPNRPKPALPFRERKQFPAQFDPDVEVGPAFALSAGLEEIRLPGPAGPDQEHDPVIEACCGRNLASNTLNNGFH